MACDCIKEVGKKLREEYGNGKFTNGVYAMNPRSGQSVLIPPSLEYSYYPKKKDGTLSKRSEKVSVDGSYCTFCGKEYNRE